MPAPLHNQNAAKPVPCDSHLHVRCLRSDKAQWVRAAQAQGGLSAWAIRVLNRASKRKA